LRVARIPIKVVQFIIEKQTGRAIKKLPSTRIENFKIPAPSKNYFGGKSALKFSSSWLKWK